jgi:hypothetical protein
MRIVSFYGKKGLTHVSIIINETMWQHMKFLMKSRLYPENQNRINCIRQFVDEDSKIKVHLSR